MSALASRPIDPAHPIRVLIVDDVALVRGLLDRWIRAESGFAVVGLAADGNDALRRLESLAPDIVLLDVEMPGADGLQILPAMLRRRPATRIVMVSTLTRRNASIALRCLALGAVDYVTKPASSRDLTGSNTFRLDLLARLRALTTGGGAPPDAPAEIGQPIRLPGARRRGCVAIGASTGGPGAIFRLATSFRAIAERAPILIAQHMPAMFTPAFAEEISRLAGIPCAEGRDGERVGPGRIYVAPGGRHMGLDLKAGEATIRLADDEAEPCRPSVDLLFRDVARAYGQRAIGLVLTGMGTDGTAGALALVSAGGAVLAQDGPTSTVWGMPGNVVRAGHASATLSLNAIAATLGDIFGGRR